MEEKPPLRTRLRSRLETSDLGAAAWLKQRYFIGWLPKPTQPIQHMLDVGCGAGHLLDRAATLGWQAEGCELSDATARRAREKGYTCYTGNWPERLPSERYHLVVMSNVLEHLVDPAPCLEAIARALRPAGIVLITVPNFGCAQARWFGGKWWAVLPPEHVWYYYPEHVAAVLSAAGLHVKAVRSQARAAGVLNPSTVRVQWLTNRRHRGTVGGFACRYALSFFTAPPPCAEVCPAHTGGNGVKTAPPWACRALVSLTMQH